MLRINDSSYEKLIKMKKYKDVYDFSSLECRIAFIVTIILDIIFAICSYHMGIDVVVDKCVALLDNIGISLIGFLGFIVTGLAILTGAISSKVVRRLKDRNKMDILERILLSFYLIGLISAFLIVSAFILHFTIAIPVKSILVIDIIFMTIFSYLITFTFFYAVKLIGNCLELFYIVNSMLSVDDSIVDYKAKYNSYRITALEKMQLSDKSPEKVQEYEELIKVLIEKYAISAEEQKILMKMHSEHFG